jgi:[ribosomal protein S18]-alanine N-acetyltransferase
VGGGARTAAGVALTAVPSEGLRIRRCETGDLERVAAIELDSFSDPWSVEAFSVTLELRHLRFLVAEELSEGRDPGDDEPALVGYVVALVMADEAEIADVAVARAVRRRGVGRALLERMIADVMDEGVRSLYLEVRESNAAARALYDALGFVPVGRRRGYYQHPSEDALLLRRDLAPP